VANNSRSYALNTSLKDDLLNGAEEIGKYIGENENAVYYAARMGYLPIFYVGGKLKARKSEIDQAYSARRLAESGSAQGRGYRCQRCWWRGQGACALPQSAVPLQAAGPDR
jgi:hypothetical protein